MLRKPGLIRLLIVNKSIWPLSLLTTLVALLALATGLSAARYLENSQSIPDEFFDTSATGIEL